MEKLVKKGKCKAIGVSNFSLAEMERLLKETTIVPASHQIELHPYLQQKGFVDFHKRNGIVVTQYSPYEWFISQRSLKRLTVERRFGNSNETYDKGKEVGKLIEDPVLVEVCRVQPVPEVL